MQLLVMHRILDPYNTTHVPTIPSQVNCDQITNSDGIMTRKPQVARSALVPVFMLSVGSIVKKIKKKPLHYQLP